MRETDGCVVASNFVYTYSEHANTVNSTNMRTLILEAHWDTVERSTQFSRFGELFVELFRLLLRILKEN